MMNLCAPGNTAQLRFNTTYATPAGVDCRVSALAYYVSNVKFIRTEQHGVGRAEIVSSDARGRRPGGQPHDCARFRAAGHLQRHRVRHQRRFGGQSPQRPKMDRRFLACRPRKIAFGKHVFRKPLFFVYSPKVRCVGFCKKVALFLCHCAHTNFVRSWAIPLSVRTLCTLQGSLASTRCRKSVAVACVARACRSANATLPVRPTATDRCGLPSSVCNSAKSTCGQPMGSSLNGFLGRTASLAAAGNRLMPWRWKQRCSAERDRWEMVSGNAYRQSSKGQERVLAKRHDGRLLLCAQHRRGGTGA